MAVVAFARKERRMGRVGFILDKKLVFARPPVISAARVSCHLSVFIAYSLLFLMPVSVLSQEPEAPATLF